MSQRHPGVSSLMIFNAATIGQKFSKRIISSWFNKLVDCDDYDKLDKRQVLASTYHENISRTA